MPSTYTLNNGIELIATGEQSGTWGDTTNTNFELLDTSLDGQVTVTLASTGSSGSPNTLPVSDGAASNGRNRLVIFDDSSDLGGTAFVQLTPSDAEKIIYVRNSLSGSRSILLFQGTYNASNDYEVPAGTTAVVFFNGAGSGAVAANVFNNAFFDSLRLGSVSVTAILDEDNMASNSATALSTQQSIKAYVDAQVGANNELSEILANGNTTGGTDIAVSAGDDITFTTTSKAIFSDGIGGSLQIYHNGSSGFISDQATGNLKVLAQDFAVNNPADAANMITAAVGGAVTAFYNGGVKLATTNTGVDITGRAVTDGVTVDGYLDFQTDGTFPTTGLLLHTNNYFYLRGGSNGTIFGDPSGNEYLRFEGSQVVVNNEGADRDLRVESDSNANMLFVDASANSVGIGTAPDNTMILHVKDSAAGTMTKFESTDAGAAHGPTIELLRNSSSPADADEIGRINFNAKDSTGTTTVYTQIENLIGDVTDGTEDGTMAFNTIAAGSLRPRLTLRASEAIFNENSFDTDFRVESDTNTHMLFVDAGNDRVGIACSPASTFMVDVDGAANAGGGDYWNLNKWFVVSDGSTTSSSGLGITHTSAGGTYISSIHPYTAWRDINFQGDTFRFLNGGTNNVLEFNNSNFIVNENSLDVDFRVESDSETHALFVDASTDRVGIKNSSPSYDLDIGTTATQSIGFGWMQMRTFTAEIPSSGTRWYKIANYTTGSMLEGQLFMMSARNGGADQTNGARMQHGSLSGYNNTVNSGDWGDVGTNYGHTGYFIEVGTDTHVYLQVNGSIYGGQVYGMFQGRANWTFDGSYVTSAP